MAKINLLGKIGNRPYLIEDENISKTLLMIIEAVDNLSQEIEEIKSRLPESPSYDRKWRVEGDLKK